MTIEEREYKELCKDIERQEKALLERIKKNKENKNNNEA